MRFWEKGKKRALGIVVVFRDANTGVRVTRQSNFVRL